MECDVTNWGQLKTNKVFFTGVCVFLLMCYKLGSTQTNEKGWTKKKREEILKDSEVHRQSKGKIKEKEKRLRE